MITPLPFTAQSWRLAAGARRLPQASAHAFIRL